MRENKNLEYKENTTSNTFLKTISAYANYGNGKSEYSNAIVHAFQGFRAPFSGKIVHIFPEQSAAFN